MSEIGEDSSDSVISSSSGGEISSLPWEVMQEIFGHLDGKTLLVCKRVCKTWKDHVHYMEQKGKFWFDNCQKEIPTWAQFDLLDNTFPCHWKDQTQVDWEEIYKCWYIWDHLYRKPVKIHKFVTGLNGISSVKVSGNWILMSTCEGRGKLTAKEFCGTGMIDIYVGGGAIINFELVNSDRHPHFNVKPPSQLEEIFNTLAHNEIWLELKECYIQLGKTYCHSLDKTQQKIRHSYGYEVRLVSEDNYSLIFLKKTCSKVPGPELMQIELSNVYSQILDFWTNTISLGGLKSSQQLIVDAISVNKRTQEASLAGSLGYLQKAEYCDVYSWHGSLFVILTSKRNILIQRGNLEKSQVTNFKKSRVTSVLFYARYFFLGTEKGLLLIYDIKNPDDCVNVTVYGTACWSIQVCSGKIIHIAVAEPMHHKGKRPIVVCATPQDVYFVSLNEPPLSYVL